MPTLVSPAQNVLLIAATALVASIAAGARAPVAIPVPPGRPAE